MSRQSRSFSRLLWGLLLGSTLAGCATHLDRLQPIRDDFFAGNVEAARVKIDRDLKKRRGDQEVLQLDLAMVELAAGRPAAAEKLLRQVRDRFDHLQQKSLAEDATSMLTDDTVRSYGGEDYEQILIRSMLAVTNLVSDGVDASAYALQVTEKQQEIADRMAERELDDRLRMEAYKQVALGPYIRAMIAEESPLTLDDAVRARVQVANWAPDFPTAKADLARAQHEVPIPPDHGVLYVFAMTGRGPVKEQVNAEATQAALFIADRIVSAVSPRGLPPTLAPVPIPKVVRSSSSIDHILVDVDSRTAGRTATIVDVGQMAVLQQQAREPEIIGRAVARRVIKKGAIYALKEGVGADSMTPESLALNVVGIAWEATERADLRCWGLLPDRIQVVRMLLPAGTHDVALQPANRHGPFGSRATRQVHIPAGRNVYMLAQIPDSRFVGEILVSNQASTTASDPTEPAVRSADFEE